MILTNGANGLALIAEVRNAFSDAIGQGAHPPLRTIKPRLPPAADLTGEYRLDPAVPMDVRRALADSFEYDALRFLVIGDTMGMVLPEQDKPTMLLTLGPVQFAQSGLYAFTFDFRRDAWGKVRGVTVSMPETGSTAYYVRQ